MSITGAFTYALSGLAASSRAAELVSSNVANAMTDGYATRTLELSAQTLGGAGSGVRINGVLRHVDDAVIGDRRLADASIGYHGAQEQFLKDLVQVIGTPGQPGALSDHVARFETALIEAATRPDSQTRLSTLLAAAKDLAEHLKSSSDEIQSARVTADHAIADMVGALNEGLAEVQTLNAKIQEARARGADPSGLMDLRQQKIDALSPIVPLKQLPRDNGAVALITTGGAVLLDGRAATLEFTPVTTIVPEMTQAGGALSGVTINGQPVDTNGKRSLIAGGALAGQFAVRDELAITAQEWLDGIARDLIERFQDPSLDTTRAPGDPGLFTDTGAAFVVGNELALSSRLRVNAAVDPDRGGALWRLRDGLGASMPGDVGHSDLLINMKDALGTQRLPASGAFSGTARSMSGLVSNLLSLANGDHIQAEARLGFASAQHQSLREMEFAKGVDTDVEMQKLMLIEQAFAANARVISTADEMIQTILAI